MGATPGRSGWPASACRFACPGFALSRRARFHGGRTKRCRAIAPSMTCCCGACCMGSRAATTRRPPRRFPGRSGVHRGQRGQAPRAPRAGPVPGGRCGPGAGRQDLRRVDDGRRAGHHDDGGETLPGLCRDGHRERAGVDPVSPVLGRAGPRCFPGASGDRRWRQGAPGGRAARLPPPRPGATVSVAQARERGE